MAGCARSLISEFHNAVGQYTVYRSLIKVVEPEYKIYLAIDDITYENFFKSEGIAFVTQINQIALLIFNIDRQDIVQWIE